jgi:hypothetical protein
MKQYNVSGLNFIEQMERFVVNNLTAISQSISGIITQIRSNRASIDENAISIVNNTVQEWTTALRPTILPTQIAVGINTTTNKLNHTRDGGTTWYNADGTVA